jgi:hypothetical protein
MFSRSEIGQTCSVRGPRASAKIVVLRGPHVPIDRKGYSNVINISKRHRVYSSGEISATEQGISGWLRPDGTRPRLENSGDSEPDTVSV